MNIEQRKNIAHALLHLTSNHIAEDVQYSAWYCGKKSDFISRHKKAIAYLEEILAESNVADHRTCGVFNFAGWRRSNN